MQEGIEGMELPSLPGRAELTRRYAYLLQHFGRELGQRPLVQHDAKFFPDRFEHDAPSLELLVRRLQTHAGMDDVPIRVRLLSPDGEPTLGGGCGSGACGPSCGSGVAADADGKIARLEESSEGWTLNVIDAELQHPVGLTTQLALALGEIFLAETQSARSPVEAPHGVSRDLACVALGLGLLVLEGSYVYAKSCGGPSVTQLTQLSVGELAVACSLFISAGQHSPRRALSGLGTTQRSALAEANDWAASNRALVNQLVEQPGQLATAAPTVRESRSWLVRLFERAPRSKSAAAATSLEQALAEGLGEGDLLRLAKELAAGQPKERRTPSHEKREYAELAALVDEALRPPS
jgi:hypothetical protein